MAKVGFGSQLTVSWLMPAKRINLISFSSNAEQKFCYVAVGSTYLLLIHEAKGCESVYEMVGGGGTVISKDDWFFVLRISLTRCQIHGTAR